MSRLKLDRTKQAVQKFDIESEKLDKMIDDLTNSDDDISKLERQLKIVKEYDRLVGLAYGCDTVDINSIETCEQCVRAGVKNPVNPADLSFVRKMLKEYS